MKNNKMKFRIEGVALTALVVAAVILINVVFSLLGEKFNLKLDVTTGGVFTLAQETKAVVDAVDKDVVIYYATNAQNRDIRYQEILEKFSKESDKITFKEVNIETNPAFARKYQLKDYNSVVVECADGSVSPKKRVIPYSLIEQGLVNDNGIINTKVNYLEGYVAAALRYVTSDDPLKIYLSVGHGEIIKNLDYRDHVQRMLYAEGMSSDIINITVDDIPEDADIILFIGSTQDFSDSDIKKIDDYMEAGGKIQFYSNPSINLPNINEYFENNWGATINNDCVSDKNEGYIASSPIGNYLIPVLRNHAMTEYLKSISSKIRVLEGETNSIEISEKTSVESNVLLSTNETGISMTRDSWIAKKAREPYSVETEGERNIMVYFRKNPLNNSETTSRLLLSGACYMIFDRMYDTSSGYGDKDLFIKTINYMSGVEDAPVSVAAKNVLEEKMEIFDNKTLMTNVIVLAGCIPFALFLWGIIVFVRRRRL